MTTFGTFAAILAVAHLLVAADPINPRIARVENGLDSPIIAGGGPGTRASINAGLRHYRVPGVSIAVEFNGELHWARGYGLGSADRGAPVTPETRFQAASLTKPVTAAVAMRLVELGELTLDEDVNTRLRSWRVPENPLTRVEKVTLRRLLSHTAGLTVSGFPGYASGEPVPTLLQLLDGARPANSAPILVTLLPGSEFRYSGGGYEVVQQLIEDVTGKPFHTVAEELILGPLGMKHSSFEQRHRAAGEDFAAGHREDGGMVPGGWNFYPELAAAGLWTTPSDLLLLVREMQNPGKALKRATVDSMLTGVKGDYGLGFGLGVTGGARSFNHNGGNSGYRGQLIAYREGGKGAVVMANSDSAMQLVNDILRAIGEEYGWPDYRRKK
jgi:CubicO group peptidase (beta-lactamase class C family)